MRRYFFHLVKGRESIPDEVGAGIADLAQGRARAIEAAWEFLQEHAGAAVELKDWRIEVADESGAIVLRIDLGEIAGSEEGRTSPN
ncbi:DUF6894 family protein [Microvirga massiliensis]|uniref:DUF6894 family protein n=1 Tax=Microvirga massiliensis TaxID=1033741 RepID=UPI00062B5AAF|nr:hypothetical protein [Microvirga massiliensis]